LIIYLFDLQNTSLTEIHQEVKGLEVLGIPFVKVGNKVDQAEAGLLKKLEQEGFIFISAANKTNIQQLKDKLLSYFHINAVKSSDVLVTNLRHYQNLVQTNESLERVLTGMSEGITGDFLAMDIRQSLHYLGEITGTITTDDLLENIFSKFCIGK
jgi:tRNA modification GTPase